MSDGVRRIGVISDTHGLLRPEAVEALAGVERILHVGDVGDPAILHELNRIAPTTAVRGNVDRGPWAAALPLATAVEVGEHALWMVHRPEDLNFNPAARGFAVVLHGHTHRPKIDRRNGVLFFNPGSAGPRRFHLPVTIGEIRLTAQASLEADYRPLL